ncbi:MAG TPA: hypothetical protein VF137_08785 [Candidatus Dormibacteraeota bacterium]
MPRLILLVGTALLVFGVVLGGVQAVQRHQASVEAQQVSQYTAGVLPQARQAGQLVAQTIVPAIDGYGAGLVQPATLAQAAAVWQQFFVKTRAGFARVAHPDALAPVAAGFDRALMEYAKAVAYFEQVQTVQAAPAVRAGSLEAKRADADYAAAANRLACLRLSLGLPALPEFARSGACPST